MSCCGWLLSYLCSSSGGGRRVFAHPAMQQLGFAVAKGGRRLLLLLLLLRLQSFVRIIALQCSTLTEPWAPDALTLPPLSAQRVRLSARVCIRCQGTKPT